MSAHTHICAHCGHEWQCLISIKGKGRVCEVERATRANKTGPFCMLCYHLEMAYRVAKHRNLTLFEAVHEWQKKPVPLALRFTPSRKP